MLGSLRALKVLGLLALASACTEQEPAALIASAAQPRARVELPSHANGVVRVADVRSGVAIGFRLLESRASPRQLRGRSAVYERAWRGAALALHANDDGVEDILSFEERPPVERVRYAVDLVGVAGLRLVARSLEFLDASGTPRLRVAPPYVVDAVSAVHEAELRVRGCRVDESSLPPWHRSPTPPGATSCELEVDFTKANVAYPARLDPRWSTTDSLAVARKWAKVARLSDGSVLIAGGDAPSPTRSAELFDPDTETWAPVGDMLTPRRFFTLVPLTSTTALAVGGTDGTSVLSTAEVFEAGGWNAVGPMAVRRQLHAATPMAADQVLVAGGMDATTSLSTAEIYDAGSRNFAPATAMNATRRQHTLTALVNGRVLASGGTSGTALRGGELYDPSADRWTNTPGMSVPRYDHEAALLAGDRVLVVGGFNGSLLLSAAEFYDPVQDGWFATGPANRTHDVATATTLDNGAVLVAGGCATTACAAGTPNAELYDPATGQWREIAAMTDARVTHVAAKLTDGRALIASGLGGGLLSSAELFSLNAAGEPCAVDVECASGSCSAGTCEPSAPDAGGSAGAPGTAGAAGAVGVGGSGGGATDGGSGADGSGAATFGGGSGGGGSGGTSGAGAAGAGGGDKPAQKNEELDSFYGCTLSARRSEPGAAAWLVALLLMSLRTVRERARGRAGHRPGFAKTRRLAPSLPGSRRARNGRRSPARRAIAPGFPTLHHQRGCR